MSFSYLKAILLLFPHIFSITNCRDREMDILKINQGIWNEVLHLQNKYSASEISRARTKSILSIKY